MFNYTVEAGLEVGTDNSIKISLISDNTVFDISDDFAIIMLPKLEFANKTLVSDFDADNYSDEYINRGDAIVMAVDIINTINTIANGVSVKFTTSSPYVLNLSGVPVGYGNVNYNTLSTQNIEFDIKSDAPVSTNFVIELEIVDAIGNVFYGEFSIQRVGIPVVKRINLDQFPYFDSGSLWDVGADPDVYFQLKQGATMLLDLNDSEGGIVCDVVNSCYWDFQSPTYFAASMHLVYSIDFWDDDSSFCNAGPFTSADDFMGGANFLLSDFINETPTGYSYSDVAVSSGEIGISLVVEWE